MKKAMTTANTLIADALTEIGVLAAGQTPTADDAGLGLRRLNQLVERWSNHRLFFPALTEISVPLTGLQSYTIGPTGAVVASRPIKVVSAKFVDASGLETPAEVVNNITWDDIFNKDVTGSPECIWYEASTGNGRVWVYPKASGYTLKMECQTLLRSFAQSTELDLPEGYESALMLTLACDLCRSFNRPVPAELRAAATAATRAIKRTNNAPLLLSLDMVGEEYQIERGY
jgi:hypothetical protein